MGAFRGSCRQIRRHPKEGRLGLSQKFFSTTLFSFVLNVFCHCEEPEGRRGKSRTNFVRLKVHAVNFPIKGVIVSEANNYKGNRRLPKISFATLAMTPS
jgi:hypothetical protein